MAGRLDDLSRTIGAIEQQQVDAADDRKELKETLSRIDGKLTTLSLDLHQIEAIAASERQIIASERSETRTKMERVETRLEHIENNILELNAFKSHVGKMIVVAGTIITGAAYLMWQGIVAFGADIKTFIRGLFH